MINFSDLTERLNKINNKYNFSKNQPWIISKDNLVLNLDKWGGQKYQN